MSGLIIEKEISFTDLAETITDQLDPKEIIALFEKISDNMGDDAFDRLVAAKFRELADRWT